MDGFNIGKIILGLQNPELYLKKLQNTENGKINSFLPEVNSSLTNTKPQTNQILQSLQTMSDVTQMLQMNTFAGMDKAVFIKNLLGLPQKLSDALLSIQNQNSPININTLNLNGLNQELLKNKNMLDSLFAETTPISLNMELNAANIQAQAAKAQQDAVTLLFSGMIHMGDVSKLILQNGKQAVAALIIAMASASKQGISNEQIQETLGIINSCLSMAESNNPAQTLKSLMLLYLPWLPLSEEVGFDLEITTQEESESNDSKLTVLIQTKNFGNLKGEFTLTTTNSIDILILCSESFPKTLLQKKLMEDSSSHAMNTNIDMQEVQSKKDEIKTTNETKVNLSATNEMNPYLLLMAHSFIRNTILIDNSGYTE